MRPLYEDVLTIFKFYEQLALIKVENKNAVVLKTDLFNESERQEGSRNILKALSPHIHKGYGIEIDIGIYEEACGKLSEFDNLDLRIGSITDIPLGDDIVDIVFDFSTIDHVESYRDALCEYARITKQSGEVIVLVWLSDHEDHVTYPTQYCFNQKEFEKTLSEYFIVKNNQLLLEKRDEIHAVTRKLIGYDLGIPTK